MCKILVTIYFMRTLHERQSFAHQDLKESLRKCCASLYIRSDHKISTIKHSMENHWISSTSYPNPGSMCLLHGQIRPSYSPDTVCNKCETKVWTLQSWFYHIESREHRLVQNMELPLCMYAELFMLVSNFGESRCK